MFKKILALVLATMMVLGGMVTVSAAEEAAAPAEEVVYDYTAAAEDLAALDILKGSIIDNEIDFALENGVTRLQMALFIARIMTGETNDQYWSKVNDNTTPYDDVVNYFGAVSFADENGIIKGKGWIPGIGDNCFDPNGAITFQDAITMAVRALGYKQLQYPQGFLKVGEELGLMADLEALDNEAELTRGQMIQILKNMLYIKVDGAASFAEQNFGLEETVYVIVATELQYMIGAGERVEKPGYVRLAKMNADGTYAYGDYIHLTEAELGLEKGEAETKIGYSYVIGTYDNYANVYSAAPTATKTVKNYGDEGLNIVAGSKYNNITDSTLVKIDGTNYNLVTSFSNLNNKSTSTGRNPELIVHSMYKGATDIANSYYIYDSQFSILNPQTGEVALIYNMYTDSYYAVVKYVDATGTTQTGYRVATEEDFAACAVNIGTGKTTSYGVVTTASQLYTIQFSEITLIDDNNDGNWDRGIYIPYSVGKYTTSSQTNYWILGSSKAETSSKTTVSFVNGVSLYAYATNTSGVWNSIGRTYADANANDAYDDGECIYDLYYHIRQSDLVFNGEGRPNNGEYVVYYYNPYSRVFTVVENLGTPVPGTVSNMTQGTYAYDNTSKAYYYKGAQVTIDGVNYGLGYRPYSTNSQIAPANYADLTSSNFTADLANYGYSTKIYEALLGNTYRQLNYVVLAGRLIYADNSNANTNWIAFDYGYYSESATGYTSYTYNGDIIGVDADGNILVKAYADTTGAQQVVKIGSINGFNYGLLVDDYAALKYQFSGIGILANSNAYETMKKIVIRDFFKTLAADLNPGADDNTANANRQYVYIVTGISPDGAYDIYTDVALYWGANNVVSYRQPTTIAVNGGSLVFYNGIANEKEYTNDSPSSRVALTLDKESVIVVAGKDGMKKATGIPAYGATINVDGVNTVAYSVSADLIFVASATMTCDQIYTGNDWDSTNISGEYTYYMVIGRGNSADNYDGDTYAIGMYDATVGNVVYTYTNMYNISTGAYETIKTVGDPLPSYAPAYANTWYNMPKPIGAIYAEKDGEYTLLTNLKPMTDSVTKATYYSATDCVEVLSSLLYGGIKVNGVLKYAPVYESVDLLTGSTPYTNNLLNTQNNGAIYDPNVSFVYDALTFYAKDGAYERIAFANNRGASSGNASAAIYFTYDKNVSFVGTVIDGVDSKMATIVADQLAAVTTVESAAQTAKAELTALASASDATGVTNALAAAVAAIDAAAAAEDTTVADITVLKTIHAGKIQEALVAAGVAADALSVAVREAQAALDAAYNNRSDVAEAKAEYDTFTAELAGSGITVERANVIKQNVPPRITAKINAFDAAADAAIKGVTAVANTEAGTVLTLKNVPSAQLTSVVIYTVDADGYATKYATVNLTASSSVVFEDTTITKTATVTGARTNDDVVLTLAFVDDFGKALPVLSAGDYKFNTSVAGSQSDVLTIIAADAE